jgi:hypothetical protein
VEQVLRDSLIKSFMVIFTHDHSQHLLLNKDLIDIAFNCLELAQDIAEEAQEKLAKLISIIFKFPQVQRFIQKRELVLGVTQLLQVQGHKEILGNTVKACTYLTMDYEFVNRPLSLDLLMRLVPLIDYFAADINIDSRNIINLIFSISNIVKGSNANRVYFFEQGGAEKFLSFVLEQNDYKVIDICTQALKELAQCKQTLRGMLEIDM